MKKFFIFLIILILSIAIVGQAKRKSKENIIVILNFDNKNSLNYSLLESAFDKLLDSYLILKGQSFTIFQNSQADSILNYLDRNVDNDYKYLLKLDISFEYKKQNVSLKNNISGSPLTHNFKITLKYSYGYFDGNFEISKEGEIEEQAQTKWLYPDNDLDIQEQINRLSLKTEPHEFIILRSLSKALSFIPDKKLTAVQSNKTIPVKLFIDSTFIIANNPNWQNKVNQTLFVSSLSFHRQFKTGLLLDSTINITSSAILNEPERFYNLIKSKSKNYGDTLLVALLKKNNRLDFFLDNNYEKLGYSQLGQKLIVINDIPKPNQDFDFWKPKYNSLTLLHELGHSLGAVHVSDINSVMNPYQTILLTDNFDVFNKSIISDALDSLIIFDSQLKYIRYITGKLLNSTYYLVDIPMLFYSFTSQTVNPRRVSRIKDAIGHEPYVWALDGYINLMTGNKKAAEGLFKKAIDAEPNQASFYYYLSRTTSGEESQIAMMQSAHLGYYQAVLELNQN